MRKSFERLYLKYRLTGKVKVEGLEITRMSQDH
jgi:hypothetical protein